MKKTYLIFIAIILLGGLFWILHNKQSKPSFITKTTPMNQTQITRPPAVAGQFYPADKNELSQMIDEFLNNVKTPKDDVKASQKNKYPQILIVPHAGYIFSGQTAAYGFKTVEGKNYDNVIILGPSHKYPAQKLSLYKGDAVQTPLGTIKVNHEIINQLINESDIEIQNEIHAPEHSLEVQIPFLQKILGDQTKSNWQIVIGLINNDNFESLKNISNSLYQIIQKYPSTLIIISSDFSHYPKYKDALESDKKIMEAILSKDPSLFSAVNFQILSEKKPNLETCACGAPAIKIAMFLADKMKLDGQILHYSNSGDNTEYGDKKNVVGYGAIVFTKKQENKKTRKQIYLNKEEQKTALKLARNTLALKFDLSDKKFEDYKNYPIFSEKRGVFVTLRTKDTHQLRGCIGLIEPIKTLSNGIIEMAKTAAFDDHRFAPVTKQEFDNIEIEISVLTPPEKISDPEHQIELGKHGVILRSGNNSGVYLPQVATDTGWDLETFMTNLCTTKAGLSPDCWKNKTTDIYTFEAQVFGE